MINLEYCHCGKPATTVDQLFSSICQDCRDEYTKEFEENYPRFICKGCGKTERIQYSKGLCFTCSLR